MQRRTLLKLGVGAAAVLAAVGGGAALFSPGIEGGRLSPAGQTVLRGVARAVLEGSLPLDGKARDNALSAHLRHVEATIVSFPSTTQAELSQLLALLACAPGRLALAGLRNDWPASSVSEIQRALQGMRTSTLELREQAYHALRDLTNAAFYAQPEAWAATGYPGPRDI